MIPRWGRSPGGGHGNPLQDSCLENPHGQGSLVGCSPRGHRESDRTVTKHGETQAGTSGPAASPGFTHGVLSPSSGHSDTKLEKPRSFAGLFPGLPQGPGTQSCLPPHFSVGNQIPRGIQKRKVEGGYTFTLSCLECGRDLTRTFFLCSVLPGGWAAPRGICRSGDSHPIRASSHRSFSKANLKKKEGRTSLEVQRLSICLPMQGTPVQLVREVPTYLGAAEPTSLGSGSPDTQSRSATGEAVTTRGPHTNPGERRKLGRNPGRSNKDPGSRKQTNTPKRSPFVSIKR